MRKFSIPAFAALAICFAAPASASASPNNDAGNLIGTQSTQTAITPSAVQSGEFNNCYCVYRVRYYRTYRVRYYRTYRVRYAYRYRVVYW